MIGNGSKYGMGGVDWVSVWIYVALVLMGWLNIYAAVFDEEHASILDLEQRYGMQLIWMGISFFVAISVLLIDDKYYHMLAFPLYWVSILLLISVLFLGREVNGSKSWFYIGSFGIQPAEFVKFTTSLVVARYMSSYAFNIHRLSDLMRVFFLLVLPVGIILLQNDTGSALVYGAFAFMFYREGANGWLYVLLITVVALFVLSFLVEPLVLLLGLFLACVVGEGVLNGHWKQKIVYVSGVFLGGLLLFFGSQLLGYELTLYLCFIVAIVISMLFATLYAYRTRARNHLFFVLLFFGSLGFTLTIDYAFDHVLQLHQQKRILNLLGLESDLQGWGYNVNQSKIAIGSGGFAGKGFLEGTQTKFNFVPEQSTDFIFCTVGEEWGFLGSSLVVVLFGVLILRLLRMGERQCEPFGRIYCYCVASIFLVHLVVNVGMTIGIMPVIGIPLPFFSYGGSSLITFTLLLFVAIKMDSVRNGR